jgi:hypothetical protein
VREWSGALGVGRSGLWRGAELTLGGAGEGTCPNASVG